VIGIEFQRLGIVSDRPVPVVEFAVSNTSIVIGKGVARVQLNGLGEIGERLIVHLLLEVVPAAVAVGFGLHRKNWSSRNGSLRVE